MVGGWVKLYRDIKTKAIYQQPPLYLRVFERLIIEANSKCVRIPYNKETKLIKRGERLTSIGQISEWVGWYERGIFKVPNKKTISDILNWLIKNELIEIANKGNARETHYNIVNYCTYQSKEEDESNAQVTPKKRPSNADYPQTRIIKNNKKYKEVKEDIKKHIYAEFVSLKEEEYKKLIEEYGEEKTKKIIETLNNYKGASGRTYKSDYMAMKNWVIDKVEKEQNKGGNDSGKSTGNNNKFENFKLPKEFYGYDPDDV